VFIIQKFVGVRVVGEFHFFRVPNEFVAAVADTDAAKQHRFGQRTRESEIRAGGGAGLASINPFLVVANRTRQDFGRALKF
jgi:hypothetical protein